MFNKYQIIKKAIVICGWVAICFGLPILAGTAGLYYISWLAASAFAFVLSIVLDVKY